MNVYSYPVKVFLILLIGVLTLFIGNIRRPFLAGKSTGVLLVLLLLTLVIRLPYVANVEEDFDTSTWISSALSLQHYPDKLWKFLNYTDSRPLTVLPILIPVWVGIPISYALTTIIGLVCWLGIIFFFYKTVGLFLEKSVALLLSWSLCLWIGTTWDTQHTAYNSEHMSILLLTGLSYYYVRYAKTKTLSRIQTFGMGMALGSLIYVKFQNVPMGFVIAGFTLVELAQSKRYDLAGLLIAGSVLPTVLVNIIYLSHEKLPDFWTNYFLNYLQYSYSTQFQSLPVLDRFHPLRLLKFILHIKQSRIYLSALLAFCILAVATRFIHSVSTPSFHRRNGWFALAMLLSSLYAIGQSGNLFSHYTLYIFVPLLYGFAAFSPSFTSASRVAIWSVFLALSLIQGVYNIWTNPPIKMPGLTFAEKKIIEQIHTHSSAVDTIVIWGWVDRWYVYANRSCGYRMPHTHQLFLKSELYSHRVANFIEDLEENKPVLFIDSMDSSYPTFKKLGKTYEHYPEVKTYIQSKYHLIRTIDRVRIYGRNQ